MCVIKMMKLAKDDKTSKKKDKIYTVYWESLYGSEVPYGLEKDLGAYVLLLLFPSALGQLIKQAAGPQTWVLLSSRQGE